MSAELGLVHYESAEQTTNADRFIPFVRALSEKMQAEPFVLYMDNLSVHKMLTVKAVYTELESYRFSTWRTSRTSTQLKPALPG